jgi:hypothetical protein
VFVADQIATRYGVLGWELSQAVLQTIALTARDGVNALDEVRRRLGLMSTSDGSFHQEPPSRRWQELLGNLFPTAIVVVDSMGSPSLDLLDLPGSEADERTIRKLLTAAASFLLAESTALEEGVDFWEAVAGPAEPEADELNTLLGRASSASCALLDHAESGSWRALLASHVPRNAVDTQQVVESSIAVPDGQHRTRPFVIGVIGACGSGKSLLLRALQGAVDQALSEGREAEVIVQSRRHLALLTAWGDHGFRAGQSPKLKYAPATPRPANGAAGLAPADGVLAVLADLNDAVTTHQPDYLIVLGSDLPTAGPLDCGKESDPQREVRDLDSRGVLPDLRGRTVVFVGLTSDHSRTYWGAVCEASGAGTVSTVLEPAEYRHELMPYGDTSHARTLVTTMLTHAISDWGSTLRIVLVVTAFAISAVGTILVLGLTHLNGYAWLAPLGTLLLYLCIKRTRQIAPENRANWRTAPIASRRPFEEVF